MVKRLIFKTALRLIFKNHMSQLVNAILTLNIKIIVDDYDFNVTFKKSKLVNVVFVGTLIVRSLERQIVGVLIVRFLEH